MYLIIPFIPTLFIFSITLFSYILCFLDTHFKCPNCKHLKKFNLSSFGTINMLLFAWQLLHHYTNCHLTLDTAQLITLNTARYTQLSFCMLLCCTLFNRNFRQHFLGRKGVLWCEKWGALNVCNYWSRTAQKLVWRQFWKVMWQNLCHIGSYMNYDTMHSAPIPNPVLIMW